MTGVRRLIWLYFYLLLFEGALRKWIIPQLDAPLLLVRDPVVFLIYFQALNARLSFTNNPFFVPNLALAVVTSLTATFFGLANVLVTIYGLRTDYLQIPLIFIIPQVLGREDVLKMGRIILWVTLPMSVLTVMQHRAPPASPLNRGAMATHFGTVRPSGTFSFGPALNSYFNIAAAFLLYGYLQKMYRVWLLGLVTVAICLGTVSSGSRFGVVSLGLVIAMGILCVVLRGRGATGLLVGVGAIGLIVLALSTTTLFKEGTGELAARFDEAGATEGGASGFVARFLSTFMIPLDAIEQVPLFGVGLGLGTNAALAMYGGTYDLPWPEAEWQRLFFECGPVLGAFLCAFRAALTIYIGLAAYRAFLRVDFLPALLFAATGLIVFNGQWGTPSLLGLAIFGGGLTLAAANREPAPHDDPDAWEDDEEDDGGDEEHDEHAEHHEHEEEPLSEPGYGHHSSSGDEYGPHV
jgi:hypothetical protein